MLEALEIEPNGPVQCSLIWLHGLGADGHDFEPLLREWRLADDLGVRLVLPHAPPRPVTVNGGMVMRAWYDIYNLAHESGEDLTGIEGSRCQLLDLIQREQARGIGSGRVLLAGFSQGGAICLHTALRFDAPLAGVLALSAYLPVADLLVEQQRADPSRLNIRMDHGEQDEVVPFFMAKRSCDLIEAQGYRVEFHKYAMGHNLCPPQMESLRSWLVERLGHAIVQAG